VLLTWSRRGHSDRCGGVLSPHISTASGMAMQWPGLSQRADGDGGDCSHWPDVTAQPRAGVE
jgi:hypothetical protein